jgi:hypothetical protein
MGDRLEHSRLLQAIVYVCTTMTTTRAALIQTNKTLCLVYWWVVVDPLLTDHFRAELAQRINHQCPGSPQGRY